MGSNMFLKVDGINGESQDAKHKDEIEIISLNWGLVQSGSPHAGSAGAGKVSVHDLSITKRTDIATPKLMLACAKGTRVKEALLTIRKDGPNQFEFIRIKINDVLVSSVSVANSIEGSAAESVTMGFSKVHVDYIRQKPDGTPDEPIQFKWDISANKPF